MYNNSTLLFTNFHPTSIVGKIIQFPLFRILIVLIFLLPVSVISYLVGPELAQSIGVPYLSIVRYGRDLIFLILFMIAYGLYTKYVERREAHEISFDKFYTELGVGILISFLMVGFMVLLLSLPGYYKIVAFNPIKNLTDAFVLQMMVGFSEELLFRLVIFKLVEEFAGSWVAIAVQGLIFGFAHIANPNATLWTSIGLVLSCTLLFGGAYMLTRRIWLIMGMHWSWNFFQAGVFGMANSGTTRPGWITPVIDGPTWITGGAWGVEASYIAVAMQFLIGLYIFRKAMEGGQIVRPIWVRRRMEVNNEVPS
jgi:membrane protease YdiL (CAAX protease family)